MSLPTEFAGIPLTTKRNAPHLYTTTTLSPDQMGHLYAVLTPLIESDKIDFTSGDPVQEALHELWEECARFKDLTPESILAATEATQEYWSNWMRARKAEKPAKYAYENK